LFFPIDKTVSSPNRGKRFSSVSGRVIDKTHFYGFVRKGKMSLGVNPSGKESSPLRAKSKVKYREVSGQADESIPCLRGRTGQDKMPQGVKPSG